MFLSSYFSVFLIALLWPMATNLAVIASCGLFQYLFLFITLFRILLSPSAILFLRALWGEIKQCSSIFEKHYSKLILYRRFVCENNFNTKSKSIVNTCYLFWLLLSFYCIISSVHTFDGHFTGITSLLSALYTFVTIKPIVTYSYVTRSIRIYSKCFR